MPVGHLRRIEVLFGTVGTAEQCFIELTLTTASSASESRMAVEVLEPGVHMDLVGFLMLVCGTHSPVLVGVEASEFEAWVKAHNSQPGASASDTAVTYRAEALGCSAFRPLQQTPMSYALRAGVQQPQSVDEAAQPQNEVGDASSLVSAKEERDLQVGSD